MTDEVLGKLKNAGAPSKKKEGETKSKKKNKVLPLASTSTKPDEEKKVADEA